MVSYIHSFDLKYIIHKRRLGLILKERTQNGSMPELQNMELLRLLPSSSDNLYIPLPLKMKKLHE